MRQIDFTLCVLAFLRCLGRSIAIVGHDFVPLVGRRTRDKRDHGFGLAHIEDFVRHAGFDVNEITGFVFNDLLEAGPEFVAHFSLDDVKDHFEIDMNMRVRDAARRNGGNIRG